MTIPVRSGRPAINIPLQVLIEDAAIPVQAPGLDVPAGCTVYVRGVNGTDAGNAKPVYVGRTPIEAKSGERQTVNPNTQVPYPCNNTREIFVSGSAGDGAQILIVG